MVFESKSKKIKHFSFLSDSVSYIAPSFNQLENLTLAIAKKVRASGIKFDLIVTLAKGGWPMTKSLADFTQISQIASIGVKFYVGIGERLQVPQVYQDLPIDVAGKKILLFDDVADTGGSIIFVQQLLHKQGASLIKTATIFYKPISQIKPDFYAKKTLAWIIFPFDCVEMYKLLKKKWLSHGIDMAQIQSRFRKIGFSRSILNFCKDL